MILKLKSILFSVILWAALSSCGLGENLLDEDLAPPSLTAQPSPVKVLTLNSAPTPGLLPHSLYFLSDLETGTIQVWRMEEDASKLTQITNEPADVNDYDISPANGHLAYTSENRLYIAESDGGNKLLIFDESNDATIPAARLHSLHWSTDGKMLAFGHGGIYIYSLDTGSLVKALPDEVFSSAGDESKISYSPYLWSPVEARLLVDITRPTMGATLGVFTPSSGEMVYLGLTILNGDKNPVCCQATWSIDGKYILIANPFYLDINRPGLWKFDGLSGDGMELIPYQSLDGTTNLVGWPTQKQNRDWVYFYANFPGEPETGVGLTIVRSKEGMFNECTPLREETFSPQEVLWASEDNHWTGVIVQPVPGKTTWSASGPVILIKDDGNPGLPLIPRGYNLHWGP